MADALGGVLTLLMSGRLESVRGPSPMVSVLHATKSAAKPGAIWPMSSLPRFLAPLWMASWNASRQFSTADEPGQTRGRRDFGTNLRL